ncbi:MAG: protein kinase [Vicinamibacterales bacterium]|jgi:serine/threonine-protein kinase
MTTDDLSKVAEVVSHYRVLGRLGAGGMGEVYLAEDMTLGRKVALKFLPPQSTADEHARQRLVAEAQAAAALDHPNICAIYEVGRHADRSFIVMQYLEGEPLSFRIDRGIELLEALSIAAQIADALAEAHGRGIIHRDLKPQNIMVNARGNAKLLDFGLATVPERMLPADLSEAETQAVATRHGTVLGTPAYMSPEQAAGRAQDARSDLFSLGVVLYEMVTGTRPFSGATSTETMAAILAGGQAPLTRPGLTVPYELQRIVSKTLARNPEDRYQTARDLLIDVRALRQDLATGSGASLLPLMSQGPAVAVLPFADMSPEKDQEYLCEGMADEVITALAQVKGLRVACRRSAFRFKGGGHDVREVGAKLNVTSVVEGSVRRAGGRLRVSAQLINAADGFHVWSGRYDREMQDVFLVQDEISRAIVHALKVKLADEQPLVKQPTHDLEAYHLYLKGRHHWNKRVPAAIRTALQYFQQALARDDTYALAHSGIADCYIVPGYYGSAPPAQVMPLGKQAALKALELDDTLALAYAPLAMVTALYEFDWLGAERHFQRALELDPAFAMAYTWYAFFDLVPQGRLAEAHAAARKALEIDPLNSAVNTCLGATLYYERRYEEAVDELQKAIELDPSFPVAYYYRGRACLGQGRHAEATSALERAGEIMGESPTVMGALAYCLAASGRRDEALALRDRIDELAANAYAAPYCQAQAHLGLGDLDRAWDCLDKAYQERSALLAFVKMDPLVDALRSSPRFDALLRKMNLVD